MHSNRHIQASGRAATLAGVLVACLMVLLAAAFWTPKAFAQTTVYWDTNSTTSGSSGGTTAAGTWDQNSTANWTTNAAGTATTATWQTATASSGIATFAAGTNATGTYQVTVSGTVTGVRGITFEEGTVTLSGGTLQLGASSTINTGATTASISSAISQAASGYVVTKSGTGTLSLSGANTYSGGTTLSAGTLNINSAAALGTGTLTINAGTINNNSGSAITLSNNNAVTLGAGLTFTGTNDLNLGTGAFSMGGAPRTVTVNGGNLTVGGVVADGGGSRVLTKAGAGTLTLTGSNTYTGGTVITGGTLSTNLLAAGGAASGIGDSSNVASKLIISGGTLQYTGGAQSTDRLFQIGQTTAGGAGTIDASGTGALNFTNAGNVGYGTTNQTRTLTLSGTNTNDNTLAALIADNGTGLVALTKNGTGKWILSGTNTYTGITTINNGLLSVATIGNGGVAGNLGQATAAASNLVLGGGTLQYTGSTASTNRAFTLTAATTSSIDVQLAGTTLTISGASATTSGALTKIGAGTLTLSGTNAYTGLTNVSDGTLAYGISNALSTGAVTVDGAAAILSVGDFSDSVGAVTVANGGSITGTSGVLTSTGTFEMQSGTVSAILGGSGIALNKTTAGTVTLSGANTYTGVNTVSAGILRATTSAQALGTGAATVSLAGGTLQLANGTGLNFARNTTVTTTGSTITSDRLTSGAGLTHTLGTLAIGAQTLNISAGSNVNSGTAGVTFGTTTLSANEATFDVGSDANLTLGAVGGAFSMVKQGTGTLTLNTTSTRTTTAGSTTLTAGTLTLGTGDALNTNAATALALNGGTLRLAPTADANTTFNGTATTIGGASAAIISDRGTALGAGLTHTLGTLAIGAQTLNISAGSNVNSGTAGVTFGTTTLSANEATFDVGSDANLTLGAVGGAFSMVKQGTGTLTLNTTSTRTTTAGSTTLTAGTLTLGTGDALNTNAATALALNGGTLRLAPTADANTTFNGTATTVGGTSAIITSDRGTATGAGLSHTLGTLSIGNQTLNILAGSNVTSGTAGVTFGATTLSTSGAVFAPSVNTALTLGSVTGTSTSFTVNGAGDATISGVIGTGTGTLAKDGVGSLTLSGSGTNTFTGTTTVSGGTLILAKTGGATAVGGNLMIGDGTGTDTVQLNAANQIAATSAVSFNAAGAPTLNLNTFAQTLGSLAATNTGAVVAFGSPGSATNLTVGGDNTSTTYAGTFTSGNANAGIVKEGTGTLTLSGSSGSYTGSFTINAGTVNLQSNGSLGSGTAGTTVANNATLQLQGGLAAAGNGPLSLTGTGGGSGALVNVSGDNLWAGNLTLAGNTTVNGGGTGGDTLRLGTASTPLDRFVNPNGPAIDASTLDLGSNTLTVSGTGTTQINSRITGTGNLTIDVATGSIARLSANQNTYTGLTKVNNGILEVRTTQNTYPGDPSYANFFGINGALQIGDGTGGAGTAVVDLLAGSTGDEVINFATPVTLYQDGKFLVQSAQSINSLTFNGGSVDTGASGTLFLDNTVTVNASAGNTATITGSGALSLTIHNGSPNATRTFNVIGGVGNTSDLTISAGISLGSIVKNGAGTMTITSDNTFGYEGTTLINNGILNIQHGKALGAGTGSNTNATTVAGDGVTNGTLQLQGGFTVSNEKLFLNSDGFDHNGALQNVSGNNQWSGPISLGSAARINSNSAADTLTLAGTTSAPAATNYLLTFGGTGTTNVTGAINTINGGVTKDGSGTLILAGNNSYAGLTDITAGTVTVRNNGGLGALTTGTTVTSGAELQLSKIASDLTIGAEALTLNGSGLSNGGTGALHNVAGANTYQGAITLGSASTIKADAASSLALTGGITGTGQALTVGGAGNITSTGAITTGTVTTGVDVHGNNVITSTGSTGTLTKVDAGTFTFGGGVTSTLDGITLTTGGITVTGTNTLVRTGPLSSAASTTLTIDSTDTVQAYYGSGNTTFSGAMAGAGTFEKDGAGTLTFNQSFAATSLTLVINGGTLALANGANIEFGTIHITGNTILDFGLSTATVLTSANLIIDQGVTVTVNNWVSLSDAWYATNSFYQPGAPNLYAELDANTAQPENQITFTGHPASWSAWVTDQGGVYNDRELRPIPEPSTYGLIFLGSSLALVAARRFVRRKSSDQGPGPV